jgi:hypothetical protein
MFYCVDLGRVLYLYVRIRSPKLNEQGTVHFDRSGFLVKLVRVKEP